MIRTFCDECGCELKTADDNVVSRRITSHQKTGLAVEVMLGRDQVWNAGHRCRRCVLLAVKRACEAAGVVVETPPSREEEPPPVIWTPDTIAMMRTILALARHTARSAYIGGIGGARRACQREGIECSGDAIRLLGAFSALIDDLEKRGSR